MSGEMFVYKEESLEVVITRAPSTMNKALEDVGCPEVAIEGQPVQSATRLQLEQTILLWPLSPF